MSRSISCLAFVTVLLVSISIQAAKAQDEGLFFSGAENSWTVAFLSENGLTSGESSTSSPYRFPPDFTPGHRYPDPAANGWNFATDTPFGIVPMDWDPATGQWVGDGTRISSTKIEASGSNTAKLCIHPNVSGDTGGGVDGTYSVSVNVTALPGGASIHTLKAQSGAGDLPDMTTAQDIYYPLVLSGGQPCQFQIPTVPMKECEWIIFEIDDPTPETPAEGRSWGHMRALYR